MLHNNILKKDKISKRPMQVGKEIKNIISDLLNRSQIKDPFLFDSCVIISDVVVSKDLSRAKVYFYPLGNRINIDNLLDAFKKNAHIFRRHIGKKLHIRTIPLLDFCVENQFDKLEEVEEMFKKIQ